MSGARLWFRMSAALATACSSVTALPSMLAGGRSGKFDNAANQGSASRHAPSALVSWSPANVNLRSSHTQPHTVQATSEKVCEALAWLFSNMSSSTINRPPVQIAQYQWHDYHLTQ